MKKFKSIIKRFVSLVKSSYNTVCRKSPYIEPVLIIGGSLLVALLIILPIKSMSNEEVITIETNEAEVAFYNNDYEKAIDEYERLQKDDKWPIWEVKIAEIYSIKGEIEKSNQLLKSATLTRNKILYGEEKDKYKDKDSEFINYVVFTYFMNGEYEEAIDVAEAFVLENGKDKNLMKTLYTIYMINGQIEKAKEILDSYDVDRESAYDLALLAKMNILVDNWDDGLKLLNEAFNKDNDEVKVYDVISEVANYDKDGIITKLTELSNKNPNELSYKMFMAKVYSMSQDSSKKALDIIEKIENEDVGNIQVRLIKSDVYKNTGNESDAKEILEDIENVDKNSYSDYYIAGWQSFESGDYDKALELSKKSIIENRDYPYNYGLLIPEIMRATGNDKLSEGYFRTALYAEPFNYNIIIKIADYYADKSIDNEIARKYYKLAVGLNQKDAETYYKLATLDLVDKKNDSAIEYLNKAININESEGKYYRALGTAYLNEGEDDKAIESIRNAYAIDENDALTLNNAAYYYIFIEENIERGMENIKAAYEAINSSMDNKTIVTITENYNKTKTLYDKYNRGEESDMRTSDFVLFY